MTLTARTISSNAEFERFFGFGLDAQLDWRDVVHPDDRDAYVREFHGRVGAREPFRAEARVRDAGGGWRWIESWGRAAFRAERALRRLHRGRARTSPSASRRNGTAGC